MSDNSRRIVELHVEHFIDQAKADSERHTRFMARLAEIARAARLEKSHPRKRRKKRKK